MEIPAQLIFFSIPAILFFIIQIRRGEKKRDVLSKLGLSGCNNRFYMEGFFVALIVGSTMWFVLRIIPPEIFENPMVSISIYQGMSLSPSSIFFTLNREIFYVTLGEEILFRGLISGYFVRRFGFRKGNSLHAFVFLLPHLLLLYVSVSFSTVVVVQFIAGWIFGWLRFRSGSIFPGWLSHSLANVLSALFAMV
jgi:membrane protease YdiL (CAAX protease family)